MAKLISAWAAAHSRRRHARRARRLFVLHPATGALLPWCWIGNFTQLGPYQPCFIAATLAFLSAGYWPVYRSSKLAYADGAACARPLPHWMVKTGLIVATILVVVALGFDLIAPLLLNS